MNLINKQKKANPNWCKNITNIFYKLTYFFLVVKLSIFELKQLFTRTFSHDAKKYVLKLRTQLVFLRKRRHCLVPVFLGFSRRKKRFASLHVNQSNKESQGQVFSCEFYEIFKNTLFTEHLRTTASVVMSFLLLDC